MWMVMTVAIITTSMFIKKSSSSLTELCTTDALDRECEEESLDCQNVKLFTLDAVMIENVNFSIKCLSLSNTHLSDLEENSFEYCQFLMYLDLQGNFLNQLPSRLFSKLSNLIYLDLTNNSLMYLTEENLFKSQKKLKILNLSFNRIMHFDHKIISNLRALVVFNLSGNPMHCDCYLLPLLVICRNRMLNTFVTCAEPEKYEGCSWDVIETEGNCTTNMGLVNNASGEKYMKPKYEQKSHFTSLIGTVLLITISILLIILICGSTVFVLYITHRRKKVVPQSEKIKCHSKTEEVCLETDVAIIQKTKLSEVPYIAERQTSTTESSSKSNLPYNVPISVPMKDTEMLVTKDEDKNSRYSGEYDNASSNIRY